MAQVKKCECNKSHPYQDDRYGRGERVCITIPGVKNSTPTYRCTVCGNDFKTPSIPIEKK